MTMDAMDNDDDEVDNIPNILTPPRPQTSAESTPDLTVELPIPMDVSEDLGPKIQFGPDHPQPGTSQNRVSFKIKKITSSGGGKFFFLKLNYSYIL